MAHLESRACISCGNTHIGHHASHGVHASGAVDHALSAVHGWHRGAMEGALFSFRNAGIGHHAAHWVDGTGAVPHTLSAVSGWHMGAVEWASVSLSHAGVRHHAAHGVNGSWAVDHALSTVHGRQRRARCWHSQGSGEEGEEEERHVEAQVLLLDNSVFTAPRAVFIPLMPLVTYLPPSLCPRSLYLLSGGTCPRFTATQNRAFISFHHLCLTTLLTER